MNAGSTWHDVESARLGLATCLSVSMHLGLLSLPVAWQPAFKPPTVLQMTLATPVSAAPARQSRESIMPESQLAPAASAVPPAPVQPIREPALPSSPPIPQTKPDLRERRDTTPPRPARMAKPKRPKQATLPPTTTKVTAHASTAHSARPRPARTAAASPAPNSPDLPKGGEQADSGEKAPGNDLKSSMTPSVHQSPPSPAMETRLQPMPGNPPPRYPPLARQRGIEGQVLLRLTVNEMGRVEAIDIAESSGNESLDREARQTVSRWRFYPPHGKGIVTQRIHFRLRN
ncbi:MAG: TonB family protein [Candidatus Competibacter sp.]